jgi:hypothetical protein
MRSSRVLAVLALSRSLLACESSTPPTCLPDASDCPEARDGSALADANVVVPDAGTGDFDAGSEPPPPACKGQLELCSSLTECCTPYACTNGTCR